MTVRSATLVMLLRGQAKTPNIDKLAEEDAVYAVFPGGADVFLSDAAQYLHWLRALTSSHPVKSGAWPNHTRVYPDVKTVPHHLKPLGYKVVQTGKLTLRRGRRSRLTTLAGGRTRI